LVELGFTHKQVNLPAIFLVTNDASALSGFGCSGVLALPVKRVVVNPMVKVFVIRGLSLLVQGDEQHMGLLSVQHNVPHVPQALVECGAEQRCNVLTQKSLANGQLQWVQHLFELCQGAHVGRGIHVGIVRVVGPQHVATVGRLVYHAQQVLVVARFVLPLNGHHRTSDRTRIAG
jgi:hypothetical protein